MTVQWDGPRIGSWQSFARNVRKTGAPLLRRLDKFDQSVLVTGCQRSGTTIVSRIITSSEHMADFSFIEDDELAAALILAGCVKHERSGRHCFQTTYLNECYREYFDMTGDHKIVWVLRKPLSVVRSMVKNWKRFALNELFLAVGVDQLSDNQRKRFNRFGLWAVSPLTRACCSYNGKLTQLALLREKFGEDRLFVIDYDELVLNKERVLPKLFEFIGLPYSSSVEDQLHRSSLKKADTLSAQQKKYIENTCLPVYQKAMALASGY